MRKVTITAYIEQVKDIELVLAHVRSKVNKGILKHTGENFDYEMKLYHDPKKETEIEMIKFGKSRSEEINGKLCYVYSSKMNDI